MGSITIPTETSNLKIPVTATSKAPELFGWPRTNTRGYTIREEPMGMRKPLRIIVLGAGSSGINFCKIAEEKLKNIKIVCYEKDKEVGGTWYENR
jgi:hypothetical protein